jgi:hypothetical protein
MWQECRELDRLMFAVSNPDDVAGFQEALFFYLVYLTIKYKPLHPVPPSGG